MNPEVEIETMTGEFSLWRCLHGGPLSKDTIDQWAQDTKMPWVRYRIRNMALIDKLDQVYGTCAVVARSADSIIGMLRFYPKAVWEMEGAGYLCLQQDSPAGPRDDFSALDFPTREKLQDQTLKIHCLMMAPSGEQLNGYQRKGIGTRMVQKLIVWAGENGWRRIEVEAFEDLPIIYRVTGSAGQMFWERLGFHLADRFPHPHLREYDEFVRELEEQAVSAGIDPERAKDCIIMRLDLA